MKINELIRYQRKKQDYTLVKLAEKAGISYTKLVRIELGEISAPKPNELRRLSEALTLDYNDLLLASGYSYSSEENDNDIFTKDLNYYKYVDYIQAKRLNKDLHSKYSKVVALNESYGDCIGLILERNNSLFPGFTELVIHSQHEFQDNINFLIYCHQINQVLCSPLHQYDHIWSYTFGYSEFEIEKKDIVFGAIVSLISS